MNTQESLNFDFSKYILRRLKTEKNGYKNFEINHTQNPYLAFFKRTRFVPCDNFHLELIKKKRSKFKYLYSHA